jgi:hypothetical protein
MAISEGSCYLIMFLACAVGILYAAFNAWVVSKIHPMNESQSGLSDQEEGGENKNALMCEIGKRISEVFHSLFREQTNSFMTNTNFAESMFSFSRLLFWFALLTSSLSTTRIDSKYTLPSHLL